MKHNHCLLPKESYWYILLGAFVILAFTKCTNDDDHFLEETRVEGNLTSLDIMNSRALLLGAHASMMKSEQIQSDAEGNSLFKITEDGVIQEIRYWQIDTIYTDTEEGRKVEIDSIELTNTFYPAHIFNAGDDHLIVCFDKVSEEDPNTYFELEYLVRKSDGAVFQLPLGYRPVTRWNHYNQMFKNEDYSTLIQKDEAGYIYFIGKDDLVKIDVQTPENITFQQITSSNMAGEGVCNFRVNGSGHIIFNSEGISTPLVSKIRYNNGGLAYPEKDITPFWLGFDNNFYFAHTPSYQAGVSSMPIIEKLTIDNGKINYDTLGVINHAEAELTYLNDSYIFRMKDINKIVLMDFSDHMAKRGDVVAEVYNSESLIKAFSMSELGITEINIGICSDNYYYLAGLDGNQPVLLKVDPSTYPHQAQQLVAKGAYDIYKMTVTSDDYVMIHALRMSDGNIVISQISPSGEVTQMEDIASEIIQLVQIN